MKSVWVYVSVTAGLMSGTLLTSCGDDAPSTDPAYYSPGGYWTGSLNGEPGVGLFDESGDFTFIAVDGEQYPGTLVITGASTQELTPYGASFSGSVQSLTPGKFPNSGGPETCPNPNSNVDLGSGILAGTIVPRQSIGGTATFTTPVCTVTEGISLTFNALYYVPSSLATISGMYTDSATGTAFTISADGTVFAQDSTTGCVINGTVSIINPSYNVYGIQVSYASCTGSLTTLNGLTLAGLAALDDTKSPEQVLAGVWNSGLPPASITYTLVRL
jgi:hypothetical protein